MTYPPATVLMRILNGEAVLPETLASLVAQEYDAPVTVSARVDAKTTDDTETLLGRAKDMKPEWVWRIERSLEHETLWTATWKEYGQIGDGVVYLLDAGNTFAPGRMTRGWDCHPEPSPVCVNQIIWRVSEKIPNRRDTVLVIPQTTKVVPTFDHLFMWSWYDTLCLRIDGRFARTVIAPLMRRTNEELGEDYFTTLVARHLNGLCAHSVYAGDYLVELGSLNALSHIRNPQKDTHLRQFLLFVGEDGSIDRLGATYKGTTP